MKVIDLFEGSGLTLMGVRFSKTPGRTVAKASGHGGGISGAERKRKRDYPETYIDDRVYFYDQVTFKQKEPGLGIHQQEATLTKIYDMTRDPDGLKKIAKARALEMEGVAAPALMMNIFEQLVVEKRYNGYTSGGIIIVFHDVRVTPIGS